MGSCETELHIICRRPPPTAVHRRPPLSRPPGCPPAYPVRFKLLIKDAEPNLQKNIDNNKKKQIEQKQSHGNICKKSKHRQMSPTTPRTETPHMRCLHQDKGQRHRTCGVSTNTKDRDTACAVSPPTQSTETPHVRCLHQHKGQRHRMCGVSINAKHRDTAHAVSPPTQSTETPHVRCLHRTCGCRADAHTVFAIC